jgi:hypothetical protein
MTRTDADEALAILDRVCDEPQTDYPDLANHEQEAIELMGGRLAGLPARVGWCARNCCTKETEVSVLLLPVRGKASTSPVSRQTAE